MIRWITSQLGTASYYEVEGGHHGFHLIDVRDLADGPGNPPFRLRELIDDAVSKIRDGKRVIVSCDMGISRSNAIALGVLLASGMGYDQALDCVLRKLDHAEINAGLLADVRRLYQPARQYRCRRVLLTGDTGFIGRAVYHGLFDEVDFVVLDRSCHDLRSDLLRLDAYVKEQGVDTILHLAHPRQRNNVAALGDGVTMMKTVLELCRLNELRLVYLSSLQVFSGYRDGPVQATPSLARRAQGTYGETKSLCESLIESYRDRLKAAPVVARSGLVYGPAMGRSAFLSKFFEWAAGDLPVRTHRYRNGLAAHDFVYIDDLVEAIRLLLRRSPAVPVHLGTGVLTTTSHLAHRIIALTGSRSEIQIADLSESAAQVFVDPQEADQALGWRARVDLNTGLLRVAEFVASTSRETRNVA